jgi:hypothetical protein
MKARVPFSAALPLVVTALAACASHRGAAGSLAAVPAPDGDGRYTFDERPPGTPRTLEGTFMVIGDTVLIDATPGPCRYYAFTKSGGPITYQCADVRYSFDRRDPVMKATYSYTATEPKSKVVCVRSIIGPNGESQCLESRTELEDHSVTRSGTLRAHRVESSSAPPATL